MKRNLDLDVMAPHQVALTLRRAANIYREGAAELQTYWQDSDAGKCWEDFAGILDRAADACEKARAKRGV